MQGLMNFNCDYGSRAVSFSSITTTAGWSRKPQPLLKLHVHEQCRISICIGPILSTFIKLPFVIKIFILLSIFEGLFYTGLTVHSIPCQARNMKKGMYTSWRSGLAP